MGKGQLKQNLLPAPREADFLGLGVLICDYLLAKYIHMYMYIYRERERNMHIYIHIFIYCLLHATLLLLLGSLGAGGIYCGPI